MADKKGMISGLAIAGSKQALKQIDIPQETYDVVCKFETPGDHGEFPDTRGYDDKNWEELESVMEDSQLWPYMTKCMDSMVDFTVRESERKCKTGFINVKSTLHWPKEGGPVFMVAGFVEFEKPFISTPVHKSGLILIGGKNNA